MQLFHWTRNPAQAAKIAKRKEEIYDSIMNGVQPAEVSGSRSFLDTLRNYNVGGLGSGLIPAESVSAVHSESECVS